MRFESWSGMCRTARSYPPAACVRQQNLEAMGETADLNEFLVGSERGDFAAVRPVLNDIQRGRCFYCNKPLSPAGTHVDHFIASARYPIDLGHNFVLADSGCDGKKRDLLPAYDYLAAWTERNGKFGDQIRSAMEERGFISQLTASNRVANGCMRRRR